MANLENRVQQTQETYQKAVNEGKIDPNTMDIERFADATADDIEFFDAPAPDGRQEMLDSERAVGQLFKDEDSKQSVVEKWFGKKS